MTDLKSRLDALREMLAKANPAPWTVCQDPVEQRFNAIKYRYEYEPREFCSVWVARELTADDAALICAARNALPALLRMAEAAKAVLTEPQRLSVTDPSSESLCALRDALRELEGE